MGQAQSYFTDQELHDYQIHVLTFLNDTILNINHYLCLQELTYFTKKEILFAYEKFKTLAPEKFEHDRDCRLTIEEVNPFKDQICKVFSSKDDGCLSFEDFLDMMSVFSDDAPRLIKTEYAFRIFDFDGDDFIGPDDLKELLARLTGQQKLTEEHIEIVIDNILEEADVDRDGMLAYSEFEHIISKTPDFISSFTIRL
ncbi:Calcium and integrin-binding protein 1 [Nymphon striatum]|nr:Calcium and integrin-binding protein 1 [Nymphon striatum]